MRKKLKLLANIILGIIILLVLPTKSYAIYEEYAKSGETNFYKSLELNKTVEQKFVSPSDFGSIEVRFDLVNRNDEKNQSLLEGNLLFELKANNNTIFSSVYPINKIQHAVYFPFGFPKVSIDPKRDYQFELTIQRINKQGGLLLHMTKDGNINYKISGERPLYNSFAFWLKKNISSDIPFFSFYGGLIIAMLFIYTKV